MFKSHKFRLLRSRAVSTVLGGLIFLVIIAAAFAAFITMMNVNTNFLQTQIKISELAIGKIQEQFTMGAAYDSTDNNKLCVSIANTGTTPLQMMDLLIVNKSVASNPVKLFNIDPKDEFVPPASTGQILDNTRLTLTPGTYSIKAVTSSGVMKTTDLRVFSGTGADPRLNVTVFAYPVNVASGQNITLGMHVFNVGNTTLLKVQPAGSPTVQPSEAVSSFPLRTASSISRLEPHEDALFYWDPEITGGVGSVLNFTASAKAKVEGCSSSSFITSHENRTQVKIVPGVRREILASPETFITFPNPIGQTTGSGSGVYAIAIKNPTTVAFSVPQVSVQLINPASPALISSVSGISPTTGWSVDATGTVIFWHNINAPITVRPQSVVQFSVRGTPTSTLPNSPIIATIFNVYSSFGQFGKGPFTVGSNSTAATVLNVYANTTFDTTGAERFTIPNIPSGKTLQRFNFTISNFGAKNIDAGAFMLINIPAGLRDIANVTTTPGNDGLNKGLEVRGLLKFADGSSQIPIKMTTVQPGGNKRSYSFTATMPSVSVPTFYTFTVVANGTTNTGGMLVGPYSESVLQVCPITGCP